MYRLNGVRRPCLFFWTHHRCYCLKPQMSLKMIVKLHFFPQSAKLLVGTHKMNNPQPTCLQGHKKTLTTAKKESKEKREIIEESKENLKAKSDDSGEEKNGDENSQKNGSKKKGQRRSQ